MRKSLALLVSCLYFITKFHSINCNENLYVSRLKNVYYIASEQKFSWYDALAKCASMNMSLVTIDTKTKSQDITALLNDLFGKRTPLWIGGCVNTFSTREFVWVSTGKKFVYTNWSHGQPDFAGNNEYCAQTGWTDSMEWNDHVCSNQFGFMCEYGRLHDCEQELQTKLQEEKKKQQEVELKQTMGEFLKGYKSSEGESKTFRDLIFNMNLNPK